MNMHCFSNYSPLAKYFLKCLIAKFYIVSVCNNFFLILLPGLSGTFRISKLFNDTNKVKELMLWWSSNVGARVSNMQQNEVADSKDEVNYTLSNENKTVKGNVEIF